MPPKKRPKLTNKNKNQREKKRWDGIRQNETDQEVGSSPRLEAKRVNRALRTNRSDVPPTSDSNAQPQGTHVPGESVSSRLRSRANATVRPPRVWSKADYYKCGFRDFADDEIPEHYLGPMSAICDDCGSVNFEAERTLGSKRFSSCCHGGKVDFKLPKVHPYLASLVDGTSANSTHFKEHIRSYNCSFAFASLKANVQRFHGNAPHFFKIQGQMYSKYGSLHPTNADESRYSQLYILDAEAAADRRKTLNEHCHRDIMLNVDSLIRKCNPYAEGYKMMKEVEDEERRKHGADALDVRMYLTCTRNHDKRVFNTQRCNEVAMIFATKDGQPPSRFDLCIQPRDQPLKYIYNVNSNGDPMLYPLLFPYGERGWGSDLHWSMLQHYAYLLAIRPGSVLHSCGKLFEQFIVTSWASVEGYRLHWNSKNQDKLRTDKYSAIQEHVVALANDPNNADIRVGKPQILPSSFMNSERYKQECFQDAMAIVRKEGPPHLFCTFTANPRWREIEENLIEENGHKQKASERPDLVARVFKKKLEELKRDIFERHIFGKVRGWVYSIEFQKRGLPHAHILIILDPAEKFDTAGLIDKLISAEAPDKDLYPRLYDIVTRQMTHGPCGAMKPTAQCMESKACCKGFPKELRNNTEVNVNGYPLYRRRAGTTFTITRQGKEYQMDNGWVVPHNKYLLYKYNAHINLEVCASIKSVKYLYKYVFKGFDSAAIVFEGDAITYDEIKKYVNCRYIGSPEAVWRLREYEMNEKSHKVERLDIHLPNDQSVSFATGSEQQALDDVRDTNLTAWFKLNTSTDEKERDKARQFFYFEIPHHYRWVTLEDDEKRKYNAWQAYQRFVKVASRIYFVSPTNVELYHLRMLLLHVKGATSFEDLKTVDGHECETFKEACRKRGLLHDDAGLRETLEEALNFKSSSRLRQTFAIICAFSEPENELELWEMFKEYMVDDFRQHSPEDAERLALADIRRILAQHNYDLKLCGLPDPGDTSYLLSPTRIDPAAEMQEAQLKMATFTAEQKELFEAVCTAVENNCLEQRCFYLDGFGGSGKTYFYKACISYFRGLRRNVIAVAWTGIAARLLPGGRTCHGQFKLPLKLNEKSACNLTVQTGASRFIASCPIIIWDEISMATRFAMEAIDRYLRDLMEDDRPFGGKVILVGGDFRQTLPIVQGGSKEQIIDHTVKASVLWQNFTKFQFTENKRTRPGQREFNEFLLKLGDGELGCHLGDDTIKVDSALLSSGDIITKIFGSEIDVANIQDLANVAILCPKNVEALEMNEKVLALIKHGKVHTYYSTDTVKANDNGEATPAELANYPPEFLHSLLPSGFPPHVLNLKVGAIIILLRNMEIRLGLCNGTRLIVRSLGRHIIEAEVIAKDVKDRVKMMIPRIKLITGDTEYPFIMCRCQFPIRLSFIMTINKAQGQEFDKVGIYLPTPIFAHGQLYTAFSRAKAASDLIVEIEDGEGQGKLEENSDDVYTQNVVYREVLTDF